MLLATKSTVSALRVAESLPLNSRCMWILKAFCPTKSAVEAAMHFNPRRRFFEEARRVLVPGGRLILTDVLARRPTTFIPAANSESTISDYARTLVETGMQPIDISDILADTAAPFAKAMHDNAMHAYGRAIEDDVSGYLLVQAVTPG